MTLFETPTYTEQEMNEIVLHLSQPIVKRYLHGLATIALTDLATSPEVLINNPEKYHIKHAFLLGSIGVLQDLSSL